MKKLLILAILLTGTIAIAEESQQGIQELVKENNKANITFMKQPLTSNSQQKVVIKNNWFCINIIDNGKVWEVDKK